MQHIDAWFLSMQQWLSTNLGSDYALAAIPVMVAVSLLLARFVVGRLLPVAGRLLVVPAALVVVFSAGLLVLTVDVVVATAFRGLRRQPPTLAYAIGDLAMSGTVRTQRGIRWAANRPWPRRGYGTAVAVLGVAVLTVWWSDGFCGRHGGGGACRAPLAQWWEQLGLLLSE